MTPLAVAETDRIAALLAEVSGKPAPKPPPAPEPPKQEPSVRELLTRANWRNAAPGPVAANPDRQVGGDKEPGPLPAPFGILTVGALFGLVNWRNRPDEAQPLPVIKPPPPPGAEFTVEAVISTFGWE
jgi:hypothetical protein